MRVPSRVEAGTTLVEVRGLGVDRGGRPVLDRVDLTASAGELVALVGPNGAGKSTLLAVLAGDLDADRGTVELGGAPLGSWSTRELALHRSVLPQDSIVSFPFTATDVVRMGRAPWHRLASAAEDDAAVDAALADCEARRLATRPVTSLSGGERARVAMARVLAQGTQLLLLDEPTAALDVHHQELVLELVRQRVEVGDGAVVVVHDLGLAAAYADRIAVLAGGRLVAVGPPADVLTEGLLTEVYDHPVEVLAHPRTGSPLVLPRRGADMTTTDALFSATLRDATTGDHRRAESSGYVDALVKGDLPVAAYADLARQHFHLYEALEAAVDALAGDPVMARFHDEALRRVPALREDLDALLGAGWEASSTPSPATARYVERIREIASDPGRVIAHHYTRYLGDLSGGLFIGRAVDRAYKFEGGPGVRFYAFDDIPEPVTFKVAYRAELDAAPWTPEERAAVLEEVHLAYDLNVDLFADLDRAWC